MPQSALLRSFLHATGLWLVFIGLLFPLCAFSRVERLRATWRSNPATSMVIGWDQVSGGRPVIFYDQTDHGQNTAAYRFQSPPSRAARAKAMNNVFARLENLQPNTVYYFVIQDTEGVSKRYSFKTAPDSPGERLAIIAGSDSRNHRLARCDANRLVSKLRPHCVVFGGDMTDDDSDTEWREWFDDWQLTIGSDGRIFPIIPARGNHESSNDPLINCFDVPSPDVYYALTLGGNLFRLYTLNTQIPGAGEQRDWLGRDLQASQGITWRMVQYHQAMRPHTAAKREREDLIPQWATLFHKYKVQLVMESDAHVVKSTWPIRPSKEPGSHEGFIRDDANGTVYTGEGGWGAPLRAADDPKPWTRSYGRFNQFKWIFVDQDKIEVRTIKTEGSNRVAEVNPDNIFEPPYGLVIWSPKEGDVVRIMNPNSRPQAPAGNNITLNNNGNVANISPDINGNVHIDYSLGETAQVQIILINSRMQEMARLEYPSQIPGPYKKSLDLSNAPSGEYSLIVKANNKLNRRFVITIP
ncbi:MAG: fibronectin type III domain-containing protein [Lewinella sp.]|uniref:fibronectin type III domain-containing protein n=1 Tax=Lewinella sp. TaxID=2004506 RepID=UPI003D6B52C0